MNTLLIILGASIGQTLAKTTEQLGRDFQDNSALPYDYSLLNHTTYLDLKGNGRKK